VRRALRARDKKSHTVFIDRDEVVKVASHGRHGFIHNSDAEAWNPRRGAGQNGELQLPGDGELVLNGYQSPLTAIDHLQCGVGE